MTYIYCVSSTSEIHRQANFRHYYCVSKDLYLLGYVHSCLESSWPLSVLHWKKGFQQVPATGRRPFIYTERLGLDKQCIRKPLHHARTGHWSGLCIHLKTRSGLCSTPTNRISLRSSSYKSCVRIWLMHKRKSRSTNT